MTFRAICLTLALAALTPAASNAQFTTFISPTRPNTDSAKAATVAVQRARTDSSARASITNMKAWVDSAAGVAQTAPVDTTQLEPSTPAMTPPPPVPTTSRSTSATTSFSNGAVAPATASYLPLIALLGLASLSIGIVLLAGRKRA